MKKLPKLPISTLPTSHRARSSWPNALAPLKLKYMSVSSLVSQFPSRRSKADAPLKAFFMFFTLLVSHPPMYRSKAEASQKVPSRLETELVSQPPMSSLKACLYPKRFVRAPTRATSQPEMWPCSNSAAVGSSTHASTAAWRSAGVSKVAGIAVQW